MLVESVFIPHTPHCAVSGLDLMRLLQIRVTAKFDLIQKKWLISKGAFVNRQIYVLIAAQSRPEGFWYLFGLNDGI